MSDSVYEVNLCPACPHIRYYHYKQEGDIYLFSNESMGCTYHGEVMIPVTGQVFFYDAMDNILRPAQSRCEHGYTILKLDIEPYEMLIAVFSKPDRRLIQRPTCTGNKKVLRNFSVSICEATQYPHFHSTIQIENGVDMGMYYPDFGGFICYETEFFLDMEPDEDKGRSCVLKLEDAYECVEVWCNGITAGRRLCPVYEFDLTRIVHKGGNKLRIEVATTLNRKVDAMSEKEKPVFIRPVFTLEPLGIIGEISIWENSR